MRNSVDEFLYQLELGHDAKNAYLKLLGLQDPIDFDTLRRLEVLQAKLTLFKQLEEVHVTVVKKSNPVFFFASGDKDALKIDDGDRRYTAFPLADVGETNCIHQAVKD